MALSRASCACRALSCALCVIVFVFACHSVARGQCVRVTLAAFSLCVWILCVENARESWRESTDRGGVHLPSTLYIKILFVDYTEGFTIIEMIGEWNDAINNDIMFLKRDIVEEFETNGINKFILIGENVLNFHASDDSYYEDWFQDVEDGWIVALNFQEQVLQEFKQNNIDYYLNFGGELDNFNWRKLLPNQVYSNVLNIISRRLLSFNAGEHHTDCIRHWFDFSVSC